jgi:hypothetical protein
MQFLAGCPGTTMHTSTFRCPMSDPRAPERVIGDLALATGRLDEAIRRYTEAIEMNARIGARPFLALSRLGLARSSAAKANPGDLPAARAWSPRPPRSSGGTTCPGRWPPRTP